MRTISDETVMWSAIALALALNLLARWWLG